MKKKIFVVGILLVLTLQFVFALGVTPGRTTINYPNDLNKTFSFKILNSENKDMQLSFDTSGDLGDYIILNEKSAEISEEKDSREFTYTLNVPMNMNPGEHKGEIIISEKGDEEIIGAKISVKTEIVFFIPYPYKYIESDVNVIESNKNETTTFLIPVINRGEEQIEELDAIVEIYDRDLKIDEVNASLFSLESMQRRELNVDWMANVPLGMYTAKIILDYDDEKAIFTKNFKVGNISFGIFDIFAEDFELGNIVKLDVLVENQWSERLDEVYANLILYDEYGNKIADFKSPPEDIEAFEKIRIPLYWDTANVSKGEYHGSIVIHYKDFSSEKKVYVDISDYGIGIEIESGGFVLNEKPGLIKIFLIILILASVIFIILRKVIKRK